jgi:hypothetical protein
LLQVIASSGECGSIEVLEFGQVSGTIVAGDWITASPQVIAERVVPSAGLPDG